LLVLRKGWGGDHSWYFPNKGNHPGCALSVGSPLHRSGCGTNAGVGKYRHQDCKILWRRWATAERSSSISPPGGNPEECKSGLLKRSFHGHRNDRVSGDMLKEITGLSKGIRCVLSPNMSVWGEPLCSGSPLIWPDISVRTMTWKSLRCITGTKKLPPAHSHETGSDSCSSTDRNLDEVAVYERKGMIGRDGQKRLGIQTWRAGDITGEHTILFGGIGERL